MDETGAETVGVADPGLIFTAGGAACVVLVLEGSAVPGIARPGTAGFLFMPATAGPIPAAAVTADGGVTIGVAAD